jgi:hypothetical protein
LALRFDAPRASVDIITSASPAKIRASHVGRWRGGFAPRIRSATAPAAHLDGGGFVVDDVVNGRAFVLEREHGGVGGVVEVDERRETLAATDDRKLSRRPPRTESPSIRYATALRCERYSSKRSASHSASLNVIPDPRTPSPH